MIGNGRNNKTYESDKTVIAKEAFKSVKKG